MPLPFLSRATHREIVDGLKEQILDLKTQLKEAQEGHKILTDILAGRALGVSVYGRVVPPKEQEEPEEPRTNQEDASPEDMHVPSRLEQAVNERGTKARGLKRHIEAGNMEKFAETEREAQRVTELAQQVGRERAEAVNGNGRH